MAHFKTDQFNIIASSCGTGKTFFIVNDLLKYFPGMQPCDLLMVTSRTMIVDQQIKNDTLSKFQNKDIGMIRYWNGEIDCYQNLADRGIPIMTYDKIIRILVRQNHEGLETLNRVKMVICDECHTLFSDTFISDIEGFKIWIRSSLYKKEKIFLGLTATPAILKFYQKSWGIKVNQVNEEILVNYRAKQLICTESSAVPFLIKTFEDKTIVMCPSITECVKYQAKIHGSAILVSKNNRNYTKEMDEIRDSIINNSVLPDKFTFVHARDGFGKVIKSERRELKVLITTSTLREGVNLVEQSGVKNIVCLYSDELHITQFMGRCRYDIDNLVVANTFIKSDNQSPDAYLPQQRALFKDFYFNRENPAWFNSVSHLIEHQIEDIKWFSRENFRDAFATYINTRWLNPRGNQNPEDRRIYKEADKQEIIEKAHDAKLFKTKRSELTFTKVIKFIESDLGFMVESGRSIIDGRRISYKLITGRR